MISVFNIINQLTIVFFYFFVYNLTLIGFFWILFKFINIKHKTLYSLNNFKLNLFSVMALSIFLFSMAGIPPFLGFFSKLLILISLINSNFFSFFFFFFTLLFLGLYFYLQNLKHLHTYQNTNKLNYFHLIYMHNTTSYYYIIILILLLIIFGFFFIDDLIFFFTWIFF